MAVFDGGWDGLWNGLWFGSTEENGNATAVVTGASAQMFAGTLLATGDPVTQSDGGVSFIGPIYPAQKSTEVSIVGASAKASAGKVKAEGAATAEPVGAFATASVGELAADGVISIPAFAKAAGATTRARAGNVWPAASSSVAMRGVVVEMRAGLTPASAVNPPNELFEEDEMAAVLLMLAA